MKTTTHGPWPIFLLLNVLALVPGIGADPPGVMNHQGRIAIDNVNHDGPGFFKFAFIDGSGSETFWTNDGTNVGTPGGEPTTAVQATVAQGHYAIPLGDANFHANMTGAIPASVFTANPDVRLRIWFSTSNAGPFTPLLPDRRITSAGYSLSAMEAQDVPDGLITANKLAAGAVTSPKIANGAITMSTLAPGAVDESILSGGAAAANIEADGSLGIGLGGAAPGATLQLDGQNSFFRGATLLSETVDGVGGFDELFALQSVFVKDGTTYLTNGNAVTIIDVSNPASPALLAELSDGVGGFEALLGASHVFVSGNTAYVAAVGDDALSIIDVSTPASPTLLAEIRDDSGGFNKLNDPQFTCVSGSVAYVGRWEGVTLIDVSLPTNPTLLTEIDATTGFPINGYVESIEIEGDIAYVLANSGLDIFDVSDPANPALLSQVRDGVNGFDAFSGTLSMAVEDAMVFVASYAEDTVTIIDASDPTDPQLVNEIRGGDFGISAIDATFSVDVEGSLLAIASRYSNNAVILDVSNPASPQLVAELIDEQDGYTKLREARSIAISGNLVFVGAYLDSALTISKLQTQFIDLATSHRVGVGTTRPDAMLHVVGDAHVSGSFLDSSKKGGSSGQVLSTTGAGTEWISIIDNDATNEFQSLTLDGSDLTLSDGGGTVSINDADADAANELQSLSVNGSNLTLSNGGGTVSINDADANATNEIQSLSFAADLLSISGGNSINLDGYFREDGKDSFSGNFRPDVDNDHNLGSEDRRWRNLYLGLGSLFIGSDGDEGKISFDGRNNQMSVSADSFQITGGSMIVENDQAFAGLDSGGISREMLKKTPDDETQLATATGEDIIFKDGAAVNMVIKGDGSVGIGETDPLAPLHLTRSDLGLSEAVTDPTFLVEDEVAGISLVSNPQYSFEGSWIRFFQANGGEFPDNEHSYDDFWAISRGKTTEANNGSSLAIQYLSAVGGNSSGTVFTSNGDLLVDNDLYTGGSVNPPSDRNLKENFSPIDGASVLEKLDQIEILEWNYKSQDATVRHLGPVAQDFRAAFGLGADERHISTVDADGVAFAAIQGLNAKLKEKDERISELEKSLKSLEEQFRRLEALIPALSKEKP